MDYEILYPEKKKRLESHIRYFKASKDVTPANKKAVLGFIDSCEAKGLSVSRTTFYLDRLKGMVKIIPKKDYKDFTREDVEKVMVKLRERKLAEWTKVCYITSFKFFWKWLFELEDGDKLPKCVSWLKTSTPPTKLTKEDLISPEDFNKMLEATNNLMHKALLCVLYETGVRPGELRSIKLKDVSVNTKFIKLYASGKMKKKQAKRPVYVIKNYDTVKAWIENHPLKGNDEAFLWLIKDNGVYIPMKEASFGRFLQRIGEKALVSRSENPMPF